MGEGHQNHHHDFLLQHQLGGAPRPSRIGGLRGAAGEIVEVQGGHIMRSTGRKDRHSKVCTAKGPRDRRVRLSAHTAIQFYDVQDRLGYDRPSKAVDWLIKNAKAAIDELAELPPWRPTVATADATVANDPPPANYALGASGIGILPPSLDSDAIADTIKSFFPNATAASSAYPEDLRLSLQSFRNPIPLQHHRNEDDHTPTGQAYFPGSSSSLVFDPAGYHDHNSRMLPWIANSAEAGDMYGMPPPQQLQGAIMPALGQSVFLAQRGPLQSSNPPFPRQWMEATDHQAHAGFASFRIPARIQGEEEHDGISSLPPVASRR